MITRDALKIEIDNLPDELIEPLFVLVKAMERRDEPSASHDDWPAFINETYGSMRESPIERLPQGEFEHREAFE
jgi:hypothetical protein